MSDKIVGLVEELVQYIYESQNLAKRVKEKIDVIEKNLTVGSLSLVVNQELKKIISPKVIEKYLKSKITDDVIVQIIDTIKDDIINEIQNQISVNVDNLIKDIITKETIEEAIYINLDKHPEYMKSFLEHNNDFRQQVKTVISELLDEKLEVFEKLVSGKSNKKETKRGSK